MPLSPKYRSILVQVLGLRLEQVHDDGGVEEAALQLLAELRLDGAPHLGESLRRGVLRDVPEELARPGAVAHEQHAVVDACRPQCSWRMPASERRKAWLTFVDPHMLKHVDNKENKK